MIFGLTQYLQFVQGYTPLEAGIRFLPASLGLMVGAIGSEMLAARYGTTKVRLRRHAPPGRDHAPDAVLGG